MKWKKIIDTWKTVFTNWKYLVLTLIFSLAFYSINVLIPNLRNLAEVYTTLGFFQTAKFFFTLFIGFERTIMFHSFVSLIVISLLFGMLFSLIGYKVKIGQTDGNKIGLLGGMGLFLGALAPGCAACGIGLASFLGISAGFLSFLPFEGLELSLASIGILSFTILNVSKNMYTCKIKDLNSERRY